MRWRATPAEGRADASWALWSSFNGALLFEPWENRAHETGNPSASSRPSGARMRTESRASRIPAPLQIIPHSQKRPAERAGGCCRARPIGPGFAWTPGEAAARGALADFLDRAMTMPRRATCPAATAPRACRRICTWAKSRPRQVWHAVRDGRHQRGGPRHSSRIGLARILPPAAVPPSLPCPNAASTGA